MKQKLESLVGKIIAIQNRANEQGEGGIQYWLLGKLEDKEDASDDDAMYYVRVSETALGSVGVSFAIRAIISIDKGLYVYTITLR